MGIEVLTSATSQRRPDLIVIGASARAACFSAARAGFAPYWLDQFGDTDLRDAFPGAVVPPGAYPAGLMSALEQAPDAPVMYTGALENHQHVLKRIAARRTLLGNSAAVCEAVRTPALLRDRLAVHGVGFPKIAAPGAPAPAAGRWLLKPVRSGGGLGISIADPGTRATPGHYLQEFMSGESFSAVYVAGAAGAQLFGITRQLVGEADFHAPAFSWCGSIGPVTPTARVRVAWEEIGNVLAQEFGLRGLFGVDAIVRDDEVTVLEVNPRYTASVEVLEAALGVSAVTLHMAAWHEFRVGRLKPALDAAAQLAPAAAGRIIGKAVLFAPVDLVINDTVAEWNRCRGAATLADVPAFGTPIPRSAPILTVLCRADTLDACAGLLRCAAAEIYRMLNVAG